MWGAEHGAVAVVALLGGVWGALRVYGMKSAYRLRHEAAWLVVSLIEAARYSRRERAE